MSNVASVQKPLSKKGYLKRLKRRIAAMPNHPRHNGIKMQAHHLISAKGVQLAQLSDDLRNIGYDINATPNLVFLPCTLQGACHLEVQLHRGDHSGTEPDPDEDEFDDDEAHGQNYHDRVKRHVKSVFKIQRRQGLCNKRRHKVRKRVQKAMNLLSRELIVDIADFSLKLTTVARSFSPGSKTGCGGVDSVPDLRTSKHRCRAERNHHQSRTNPNRGQRTEAISFLKPRTPYRLKVRR